MKDDVVKQPSDQPASTPAVVDVVAPIDKPAATEQTPLAENGSREEVAAVEVSPPEADEIKPEEKSKKVKTVRPVRVGVVAFIALVVFLALAGLTFYIQMQATS